MAFAFAIAANVIAAIASLLTGPRNRVGAAPESLGAELAGVAGEGGIEPSELVGPGETAEGAPGVNGSGQLLGPGPAAQGAPESRGNGQSPAVTKSSGKEPS